MRKYMILAATVVALFFVSWLAVEDTASAEPPLTKPERLPNVIPPTLLDGTYHDPLLVKSHDEMIYRRADDPNIATIRRDIEGDVTPYGGVIRVFKADESVIGQVYEMRLYIRIDYDAFLSIYNLTDEEKQVLISAATTGTLFVPRWGPFPPYEMDIGYIFGFGISENFSCGDYDEKLIDVPLSGTTTMLELLGLGDWEPEGPPCNGWNRVLFWWGEPLVCEEGCDGEFYEMHYEHHPDFIQTAVPIGVDPNGLFWAYDLLIDWDDSYIEYDVIVPQPPKLKRARAESAERSLRDESRRDEGSGAQSAHDRP